MVDLLLRAYGKGWVLMPRQESVEVGVAVQRMARQEAVVEERAAGLEEQRQERNDRHDALGGEGRSRRIQDQLLLHTMAAVLADLSLQDATYQPSQRFNDP